MAFDWDKMFNENKGVTEPNADMRSMARSNWECFQAHRQEGFTDEQAMQIVVCIISTFVMKTDLGGSDGES